jgi:hypothetical protein
MAILGGSPLGLIGVTSKSVGGYSTFNGGRTRNVNVTAYNKSNAGSLFTGKRRLRAWPDIKPVVGSPGEFDTSGTNTVDYEQMRQNGTGDNYTQKALHNNDVYDTSILNLIEKLSKTKASLRPADFAYLKELGVYPNNRLMIARRFATPIDDNIMVNKKSTDIGSLATLITWVDNDSNFIEISFGEEWGEAKADFTGLLNRLGDDFGRKKSGLGELIGSGAGAIPLPGFSEMFQRQFLEKIGLLESGSAAGIPAGNPNLIKEAKVRKTVDYGEAGSGLMAKVSFTFETEYELKFISGIDPSIVWMDLIGMILRFGTSESSNYGLSKKHASKIKRWISNPDHLLTQMIGAIKETISGVKEEMGKKISEIYQGALNAAKEVVDDPPEEEKKSSAKMDALKSARIAAQEQRKTLGELFVNLGDDILKGTIQKYRTEILGIVNSLTGAPSTPWHITIGNPLRPLFCSGDMLTKDVKITMGPQLAFNDLPSSIKVSFTLENARNLGMQEISGKFNSGYLRTVDVQKTYYEAESVIDKNGKQTTMPIGGFAYELAPDLSDVGTQSTPINSATNNTGNGATGVVAQADGSTKVQGDQQTTSSIVKDPTKSQG